jgi:hypothetical protein
MPKPFSELTFSIFQWYSPPAQPPLAQYRVSIDSFREV